VVWKLSERNGGDTINTSNDRYYVEKAGQGKSIIFLPAAGYSGNEGMNIAEHLSDGYETHMIDLPGFGRSKGIGEKVTPLIMAEWLKGYLDQEGIEKAILIGHSMGGAILLVFAVHFPERVKKLILLNQGHKRFPRVPVSEFGVFAFAFPFLSLGVRLFGPPLLKRLEPLFSQENEPGNKEIEAEVARFCEKFSIPESTYVRLALEQQADISIDALNLMFGYYNLNLPVLLEQVKVPIFLVYATFEDMDKREFESTKKAIRKLKRKTESITYRSLNSGHYVHWSDSFELDELKDFLDSPH
jgi:2-hydroxy-6-oxonona-2,4-dienedioate hydrolase